MIRYDIAYSSVIGERKEQQDSFEVRTREGVTFAVVCDGLGGHKGGALASRLAADMLTKSFEESCPKDIPSFFAENVRAINDAVYDIRCDDGSRMGAGTTMVCAVIDSGKLYRMSVGDSRIYLFRDGQLMQLTVDHNYLLVLDNGLASGRITQEEYDSEYYKGSSLISVLGMDELVRVDINTKPLELVGGDVLILMSDGLYKALDDDEIAQCLSGDAQSCCDELMRRIEKSKFPLDNTTFIVERIITEG